MSNECLGKMKRSAAPSQKSSVLKKHTKFVTPYLQPSTSDNLVNSNTTARIGIKATLSLPTEDVSSKAETNLCSSSSFSSTLNSSATENLLENLPSESSQERKETSKLQTTDQFSTTNHNRKENKFCVPLQQSINRDVPEGSSNNVKVAVIKRYFSVVWCKRSAKKHKNWEGKASIDFKFIPTCVSIFRQLFFVNVV